MIRSPRQEHQPSNGVTTQHFAEALDLYRTLAALAGFSPSAIEDGVEGTNLEPVFRAPAATVLSNATYSQMARYCVM